MVRETRFALHSDADAEPPRVVAQGELDMATAPQLSDAVEQLLAGGARRVRIDLSALTFADSSGLRLVIELHLRANDEEWDLELVRPSHSAALAVFKLSGSEEQLPFVES